MSQYLRNVLALVRYFGPLLASLKGSFPAAFKAFEKMVGFIATAAARLTTYFPKLAPFAEELKEAAAFLVAHEAEITGDADKFFANVGKLLEMLANFQPPDDMAAVPKS